MQKKTYESMKPTNINNSSFFFLSLAVVPNSEEPMAAPPAPFQASACIAPLDPGAFPNPPQSAGSPAPCTIVNVKYFLLCYGIAVRYDVIKKKLRIVVPGHTGSPDNFDNSSLTRIFSLATLNRMSTGLLAPIVDAIGDENQYNPVATWIGSKLWDGVDRLPQVYATLVQREGFPEALKVTVMSRWLMSLTAAALMPVGFRGRGVLTLQGPQGIGKTQWTKALVSDPALRQQVIKVDHHMDAGNKDSMVTAIQHWIVEIGELDSSFKKDIARLKGFLTSDQDKVRRPYARVDSEYPRRTVFCATVNDENFLVDSTGNTRFWTLPVTKIDYAHDIDMQQVFAQLKVYYDDGVQWWLTADEEAQLEEQNKKHRAVSAIRERLLDAIDPDIEATSKTPAMTCTKVLKQIRIEQPTSAQVKECGVVLRELLGDPTMTHGQSHWRVPFREVDESSFKP